MDQRTTLRIWIVLTCFFALWALLATIALFVVVIE